MSRGAADRAARQASPAKRVPHPPPAPSRKPRTLAEAVAAHDEGGPALSLRGPAKWTMFTRGPQGRRTPKTLAVVSIHRHGYIVLNERAVALLHEAAAKPLDLESEEAPKRFGVLLRWGMPGRFVGIELAAESDFRALVCCRQAGRTWRLSSTAFFKANQVTVKSAVQYRVRVLPGGIVGFSLDDEDDAL